MTLVPVTNHSFQNYDRPMHVGLDHVYLKFFLLCGFLSHVHENIHLMRSIHANVYLPNTLTMAYMRSKKRL